jgi:hypothetical protein
MTSGPRQALVAVRLGLGGVSWVAPRLLQKALGAVDPDDPVNAWMARMFAVRDAVLGVGVVCTTGEQRRFWLKVGLACDLADLAGGILAARHPTKRRVLLKFAPMIGAGLGAVALKQERNGR